jgi:hypothetical protein
MLSHHVFGECLKMCLPSLVKVFYMDQTWCNTEEVCQFYNVHHSNRVGNAGMLRSLMLPIEYVWMLL